MSLDKNSEMFALKKGLDGFFEPIAKAAKGLGGDITSILANIITGARGDTSRQTQLANMPSASDYYKDRKSLSEEYKDMQDTINAPSGFLGKTRKLPSPNMQDMNFTMNKRLAQRVQQLVVKDTFQDPMVGKYLKGVGLTMGVTAPNIKTGSTNPTQALKDIG